jgi:biopolymer transport protein ExbD
MLLPEEDESLPQINIVPMIDVIFAILTFFIMASLFLTRSESLPVNLPRAQTAQNQSSGRITISIDAEGKVFLNRQLIDVSQLSGQVRQLMGNSTEALAVINADEKVDYGRVIAVMDQLRSIPGVKIGMATRR